MICNCGAPVHSKTGYCGNCHGVLFIGKLELDIDHIPEPLYKELLKEFKRQFGHGGYTNWVVSAEKIEI